MIAVIGGQAARIEMQSSQNTTMRITFAQRVEAPSGSTPLGGTPRRSRAILRGRKTLAGNLRWGETPSSPDFPASHDSTARRSLAPPVNGLMVSNRACRTRRRSSPRGAIQFIALLLLLLAGAAQAQVHVRTLGGGRLSPSGPDAGWVDGDTLQSSQFNAPSGAVADAFGNLYIADRNNGAVRKLNLAGNRSVTLLRDLSQPIAVAVDATNQLYILTQGDGLIRRLDRFGTVATNRARFQKPTALALGSDALYVTEAEGPIIRVDFATERQVQLPIALNRPGGVAMLENGLLAVSEIGGHRITLLTTNGEAVARIGTGTAGFRDGSITLAQFNQPHHLAKAPGGGLLVADSGNHRIRAIDPDGTVRTVFGIDPKAWEGPECVSCVPMILPGWLDGPAEFAEARDPVGVTVGPGEKVYVTENFYHLIREITGMVFGGAGGTGDGPNVAVVAPTIFPVSGYYPLGQDITVVNPNTNVFFKNAVYYMTDGTTPTTNSPRLALNLGRGTIRWRETTRDLTALRVLAMVGDRPSEVVRGQPAATNEIGISRDIAVGRGATVIVPVTVNLKPADFLRSLQFRVEIEPTAPGAPLIPEKFRVLSISTNDFIPVVTSSQAGGAATFSASPYTVDSARGLAITYLGTNAHLSVQNFGVVAHLAVPIPANAQWGSRYRISVLRASGTSDGAEASVALRAGPPRELLVGNLGHMVGDSSPATWYNADSFETFGGQFAPERRGLDFGAFGFGDQELQNADVNNVFAAALGLRLPYTFSDLFDAMDAYPEDTDAGVGGDGLIRFLDWQIILRRSLGLDTARWRRDWGEGGVRVPIRNFGLQPNLPSEALSVAATNSVWWPQAAVGAIAQENVMPGMAVDIPIYVWVTSGYRLAGLAFRATIEAEGTAPAVVRPLEFIPAPGLPSPAQGSGSSPNVLLCGWSIVPSPAFEPPLQNSNRLGHIRFTVPFNAQRGQAYTLRFANTDGSPDLRTQYEFETRPASVWIQSGALRSPDRLTDEWKIHFFGSVTNESARADADPDRDGYSNWAEYQAGTDPSNKDSFLRFETSRYDARTGSVVLRWHSAPGKSYRIETSSTLFPPNWADQTVELVGHGAILEWTDIRAETRTHFYRLRIEP